MNQTLRAPILALAVVLAAAGSVQAITIVESFPSPDSTRFTELTNYWNAGDFVEELFVAPGITELNALSLDLPIDPNVLDGSDTQDMDVTVNGVLIGDLMVSADDTVVEVDFSGLSIPGVGATSTEYLLRIETTRTVISGAGSAGIPDGTRNLTLVGVPEPVSAALLGLGMVGGVVGTTRRRA